MEVSSARQIPSFRSPIQRRSYVMCVTSGVERTSAISKGARRHPVEDPHDVGAAGEAERWPARRAVAGCRGDRRPCTGSRCRRRRRRDVAAAGARRAPARAPTSIPSVTKWKVVPPSIGTGSRGWWVSTNTGRWYGGSSPHQPRQSRSHSPRTGPNMLRPMMYAFAARIASSSARCFVAVIEHPRVQDGVIRSVSEGCLLALVVARGVPVRRNREICIDDAHDDSLLGCPALLPDSGHDIRELRHAGHRDRQAG